MKKRIKEHEEKQVIVWLGDIWSMPTFDFMLHLGVQPSHCSENLSCSKLFFSWIARWSLEVYFVGGWVGGG